MNKDLNCIQYIKEYCEEINATVQRFGNEFAIFESDSNYYKSVSMTIYQIGELTVHLSDEFKDKTKSQMPWSAIRGLRNLFAHNYVKMNKEVIWEVVTNNINELLTFCERVIAEHGGNA